MKAGGLEDLSASIRQRLLNLAKARGEEFTFVLLQYGLERLLYRLGQSRHAGHFILKSAMLFPLWPDNPHRATKDMCLLNRFVSTGDERPPPPLTSAREAPLLQRRARASAGSCGGTRPT